MKLIIYFTFILSVYALESVPVILSSHRVVKGLKSKKAFGEVHTGEEVTNLAKQLITECSSDEYILVNQPGLILEDLRIMEKDHWPFLRKYLAMSSTVLGIPRVNSVLDLAYLEKYIIKTCDAETIRVVNGDEEEVEQYYDVRTRVIQVQMPELPDAPQERIERILKLDDLIRKIIRKLPSPHYSVILTSDKLTNYHYTPESVIEDTPEKFQIFSDIVHDPSREFDIERHDMYQQVEPDFRAPRHTNDRYLRNKKKDEIHLFNYELWKKNEQLIMTIAVMIIGLLFLKFTQLMKYVFTKGQNNNRNKKNGLLDKQD